MSNRAHLYGMLGVANVGGRFVTGAPSQGALGDDGAVMMISGLGQETTGGGVLPGAVDRLIGNRRPDGAGGLTPRTETPERPHVDPVRMLQVNITLWGITLPLWGWLMLSAMLGGGAGYLIGKKG